MRKHWSQPASWLRCGYTDQSCAACSLPCWQRAPSMADWPMRRWFPCLPGIRRRRCTNPYSMTILMTPASRDRNACRVPYAASRIAPGSVLLPMPWRSPSSHRRPPGPWPSVLCPAPGPGAINPSALRPNLSSKFNPVVRYGRTTPKATASLPRRFLFSSRDCHGCNGMDAVLEERTGKCPISMNVLKPKTATPQPI